MGRVSWVFLKKETFGEGKSLIPLQQGLMSFCRLWPKSHQHPPPPWVPEPTTHQPKATSLTLPLQSALRHRFFIPSAHDSSRGPSWDSSALWQPVPSTFQTGCSWGLHGALLGGRPAPPPGSLLWGAGTSASTLLFVYQFLANEPFSSTKESYPEW